jgi:hypothetical protein
MSTRDHTYSRKVIDRHTVSMPRSYKVRYVLSLSCGHQQDVPASAYNRNRRTCDKCKISSQQQPFIAVDD